MKQKLVFSGPVNIYTGYGQHSCRIIRDFESFGYDMYVRPLAQSQELCGQKLPIPKEIRKHFVGRVQQEPWELLLSPPIHFPTHGKKVAYFTMWESSQLSKNAVTALNHAEVVIVPCKWNEECFRLSGVTRPIRIVPLGIDMKQFRYSQMDMDGPCVFGVAGRMMNGGIRKGLNQAISVFQKAFPTQQDVRLRVKCFQDCDIDRIDDPRVDFIQEYIDGDDLAKWFHSLTCFVSCARGEGWGLMQQQAMAVGRPIISVYYGGVADYFDHNGAYSLDYTMAPADGPYKGCGYWAEPREEHLIELMRLVYTNRRAAQLKGKLASEAVQNFSWENSNRALERVLHEHGFFGFVDQSGKTRSTNCVVCLGRYGDIINILPTVKAIHDAGKEVTIAVNREHEDILDGVSYAKKEVFNVHHSKCEDVAAVCGGKFDNIIYGQTYGREVDAKCDSFNVESWSLAGRLTPWEDAPVFDRRDFAIEASLANGLETEKPMLILNLSGKSSPFPNRKVFALRIRNALGAEFNIVDISDLRVDRIYHLLGLMDRASFLITTDTATLHLAAGSNVPYIALLTDTPSMWHGSRPKGNVVMQMRYTESDARCDEIIACVRLNSRHLEKVVHVYSAHTPRGDAARRHRFAEATWRKAYRQGVVPMPIYDCLLKRMFDDRGRRLPFIKDLLEFPAASFHGDTIVILTNADTCFAPNAVENIIETLRLYPALCSYRRDFDRIDRLLTSEEVRLGAFYVGADLFAFRISWWWQVCNSYPDMVLGAEAWDWCMRTLIKMSGGKVFENLIYHEKHDSFWERAGNFELPSNIHNRRLARPFLVERKVDMSKVNW